MDAGTSENKLSTKRDTRTTQVKTIEFDPDLLWLVLHLDYHSSVSFVSSCVYLTVWIVSHRVNNQSRHFYNLWCRILEWAIFGLDGIKIWRGWEESRAFVLVARKRHDYIKSNKKIKILLRLNYEWMKSYVDCQNWCCWDFSWRLKFLLVAFFPQGHSIWSLK